MEVPEFIEPTGPTHHLPSDATPLQYFLLMFPLTLIQVIVENTNLYARQSGAQGWVDTTIGEMKAFLGLQILMGIVQLPRYTMYWSSDKYIGNAGFQETMTLKRFEKISRYFHLNDNTTQGPRGTQGFDRLHKIRPVLDATRTTFKSEMNPPQQQSIDEGMIKYKGRFFARQYMPSKPVKRGLKIFMRCDETGYCYDYWPYMENMTSFMESHWEREL
uniref:PiggyBac transposable element-derived protein 4-like n=1 Tax=Crassostrea virginica TaxID=6565 RepID=A0A8B8AG00_CRAVI|nr:piggyBac transposable element-derived protein 4-like [Crassostrea virginica]